MTKTAASEQAGVATLSFNAANAFETNLTAGPERGLQLGYVQLGDDHPRPRAGKTYPIVPASSEAVGAVSVPAKWQPSN